MDQRDVRIAGLQHDLNSLRTNRGGHGGTTSTSRHGLQSSRGLLADATPRPTSRAGTSRLASARVEVVPKPADGSCLFHSMAHGLNDGTRGPELRQQIAGFIKTNPDFKVGDTKIKEWVKWDAGTSVNDYADKMVRSVLVEYSHALLVAFWHRLFLFPLMTSFFPPAPPLPPHHPLPPARSSAGCGWMGWRPGAGCVFRAQKRQRGSV
jgi:hypothetical protein